MADTRAQSSGSGKQAVVPLMWTAIRSKTRLHRLLRSDCHLDAIGGQFDRKWRVYVTWFQSGWCLIQLPAARIAAAATAADTRMIKVRLNGSQPRGCPNEGPRPTYGPPAQLEGSTSHPEQSILTWPVLFSDYKISTFHVKGWFSNFSSLNLSINL